MNIKNIKSLSTKKRLIIISALVLLVGTGVWTYWSFFRVQLPQVAEKKPSDISNQSVSPPASVKSYTDQILASMTLRDKIASLFILHMPGTDLHSLAAYQATYKPAGLIFMEDNIPNSLDDLHAQTNAITQDKMLPPLLAVDEEGDTVKRLAADTYPGALTLPNKPPIDTKIAFSQRSALLKSVGLNLNFGIVADVTANPTSFIFPRVLGITAYAASERVAQAVIGSKEKTLSTIKHFPGHGETEGDSHTSIPTATTSFSDWKNRVSLPFKSGIQAGADLVMFGHLRYSTVDSWPATLSKKWHDIIRNDLGYKGLIITDDMVMLQNSGDPAYTDAVANSIAALQVGNDLLLFVNNHNSKTSNIDPNALIDGVLAAVNDGRIDPSTIDQRAKRVLDVRHALYSLQN